MPKALKWAAIVIGGLIVLVVAAILLIPSLVNIESYRGDIAKAASDKLGRPVAIAGDMKLSILPNPSVILHDLRIDNPPEFKGPPLVGVGEAALNISLWPLFEKKLVVENFILKSPKVSLVKAASGKGNWEGLGGPAAPPGSPQPPAPAGKPAPPTGKPSGEPSGMTVEIKQASIEKGELVFSDPTQNKLTTVSGIALKISNVSLDQAVGLEFSALVDQMPVNLKGTAGPLDRTAAAPFMPVDFQLTAFDSAKVNLKGRLIDPMGKPAFDLNLDTPAFSPRQALSGAKGFEALKDMDSKSLQEVSFKAGLKGSPDHLVVEQGYIKLDRSDIAFSVDIDLEKRSAIANLTVSQFHLDPYLSQAKGKEPPAKKEEKTGPAPAAPSPRPSSPASPAKPWAAQADVKVGEFRTGNIALTDFQAKIDLKDNVLNVSPFAFGIFQGRVEGAAERDARQEEAKYKLKVKIQDVQMLALLKDLAGKQDLSGVLRLDADLTAAGSSGDQVVRSLAGQGEMLMSNVHYRGSIEPNLEKVIAALAPNSQAAADFKRVDRIVYPFTAREGVLNTRNGRLSGPHVDAGIAGTINLVAQTLFLNVNAKLFNNISIPITVSGPLASPSVKGDLDRIPLSALKNLPADVQNLFEVPPGLKAPAEIPGQVEKKAEELLKKLPFGR